MSKQFHERRRQQFMTESFSGQQIARRRRMIAAFIQELSAEDTDAEGASLLTASAANDEYERLSLRYTAGEPIEQLRVELTGVIEAYERFAVAKQKFEQDPEHSPLYFAEIADYERCMQLIALCYLLHRRDLLPRIAVLEDPRYKETDTLYEDLLAFELEGRFDIDQWYHDKPYRDLINSLYRDTPQESLADLQQYVKGWYRSFKYAPWHDGHLRINGDEGDYFGYWAFEAGAVALLCDIDDSSIEHMVYPHDLVAWARKHKHLSESDGAVGGAPGAVQLRCEAEQPCPREGWWFTPAKADSRQHFEQGAKMPDVGGDYGATIWQWDQRQG